MVQLADAFSTAACKQYKLWVLAVFLVAFFFSFGQQMGTKLHVKRKYQSINSLKLEKAKAKMLKVFVHIYLYIFFA